MCTCYCWTCSVAIPPQPIKVRVTLCLHIINFPQLFLAYNKIFLQFFCCDVAAFTFFFLHNGLHSLRVIVSVCVQPLQRTDHYIKQRTARTTLRKASVRSTANHFTNRPARLSNARVRSKRWNPLFYEWCICVFVCGRTVISLIALLTAEKLQFHPHFLTFLFL